MSGLLAQFSENRIEQRIFELLRNDCAFETEITGGETEPLEIAVMVARRNERPLRVVTLRLFEILELDVIPKIFRSQPRAPQQVEHRPREVLKRFAHDFFALRRAETISKRHFQIADRNSSAVPVQDRHQPAKNIRKLHATSPRQQWNDLGRCEQSQPLEAMPDLFPERTHGALLA